MKAADYLTTLALVGIVLFFTLQKGSGFFLVLLLPFFLINVIYNSIRMFRRLGEIKSRGIRLAIWSIALALAGAVQIYWSVASHNDAQIALQKVLAYKEQAGRYPATLKEVGLDDQHLKDKWRLRYSVREGKPALTYPVTFVPLDIYEYDFETRRWRENAY